MSNDTEGKTTSGCHYQPDIRSSPYRYEKENSVYKYLEQLRRHFQPLLPKSVTKTHGGTAASCAQYGERKKEKEKIEIGRRRRRGTEATRDLPREQARRRRTKAAGRAGGPRRSNEQEPLSTTTAMTRCRSITSSWTPQVLININATTSSGSPPWPRRTKQANRQKLH